MFIVVNLRFLMINKKISYCINKKETTACSVVTKETIVEPFLRKIVFCAVGLACMTDSAN